MRESAIQSQVLEYLKIKEAMSVCLCERCNSGTIMTRYGNKNYPVRLHRVGFPDVMVIKKGKVIFFEIKAAKGKPTPEQVEVHELLREHGCEVYIVRSLDEVVEVIE